MYVEKEEKNVYDEWCYILSGGITCTCTCTFLLCTPPPHTHTLYCPPQSSHNCPTLSHNLHHEPHRWIMTKKLTEVLVDRNRIK